MATPDSGNLVDTAAGISTLVDVLYGQPTTPPSLYVDLEGVKLSRHGSISILQIYVRPLNQTYLVDVYILGETAFRTPGAAGRTLRDVLEDAEVPKVFFDVRRDSDALFSHFDVRLAGVVDVQLMEFATRPVPLPDDWLDICEGLGSKTYLSGLAKCVEQDSGQSPAERAAWTANKQRGRRLFEPELGGSYAVFNKRPLSEEVRHYCVQDVRILPRLWTVYNSRLKRWPGWDLKVREATLNRIVESQSPSFNCDGPHMARGPASLSGAWPGYR